MYPVVIYLYLDVYLTNIALHHLNMPGWTVLFPDWWTLTVMRSREGLWSGSPQTFLIHYRAYVRGHRWRHLPWLFLRLTRSGFPAPWMLCPASSPGAMDGSPSVWPHKRQACDPVNRVSPGGITQRLEAIFSSVQSLSCVWLFVTPWPVACQAPLSMRIL